MSNTTVIPISLPKSLAGDIDRAAKAQSMTRSEFVRDSIRRQLAFKRLEYFRKEVAVRAKRAGLDTFEGAVKAVREIRSKK